MFITAAALALCSACALLLGLGAAIGAEARGLDAPARDAGLV
ncbi:hypothetical protein [Methylobacterium soli]|jgi:hypothetical protein|nr:hypothetical protein [Methylobacterium soli]GJE41438.1 hypothetical protein AEGHOMDF_0604 [Methylobacterium soli]